MRRSALYPRGAAATSLPDQTSEAPSLGGPSAHKPATGTNRLANAAPGRRLPARASQTPPSASLTSRPPGQDAAEPANAAPGRHLPARASRVTSLPGQDAEPANAAPGRRLPARASRVSRARMQSQQTRPLADACQREPHEFPGPGCRASKRDPGRRLPARACGDIDRPAKAPLADAPPASAELPTVTDRPAPSISL